MKKILSLIIITLAIFFSQGSAQTNVSLKFGKNGKFKIAQFTDLHWNPNSPSCAGTTTTIKHILQTEKPDIAILTGDVVTSIPAKEGWRSIIDIFEETSIPFSVIMGNHDAEMNVSREKIYEWLSQSPYFLGEKGPEDIHGCGNFVLEVKGSRSNAPAALLYCFDSNDYPENTRKYGHYDWIRYDQIKWYRQQSEKFTQANNGKPLPAIAFLHIPLPEYSNVLGKNTTIGNGNRGNSSVSSKMNSGLFSSMNDMGDVMGTFAGHVHSNDYIGINYGIALAFGRTTGLEATCRLERGGRMIELQEEQFKFDTWISTMNGTELHYYYPSGISSVDNDMMEYLPAKDVTPKKQGVNYIYYEGTYESISEITPETEVKRGSLPNFSIKNAAVKDHFGYEFNTWIKIPEKGVYLFYTYSDDGSKLLIDGHVIVDNDGSHSARFASGKVALDAGFHEMKLHYFESYMGEELEVGITSRNIEEMIIPDEMLFLPE